MTAPRRPPHTDQLKTLQAEMGIFEDRLRNARRTSRSARWLLSLAAFFGLPVRLGRSLAYRWRSR